MANPLTQITPILDLLGRELKILPATGGAVEDLQRPDQEEILNLSLSNECFGLDMSSLYAVLLAVKSRLPILSADTAAIKAIQKLVPERLGEVRI